MSNVCVADNADMKTGYSALEVFTTPRVEGEKDLVEFIYSYLSLNYNQLAATIFATTPDIDNVKLLNPLSQRVIINRWFNNKLLVYRNRNEDKNVSDVLEYVSNDTTEHIWLESMRIVVIPFFKLNNVLNIQMGE